MPELPEVETVRRQLAESLTGLRFVAVARAEPSMLIGGSAESLRAELPGRDVQDVSRIGKFLIVKLGGAAFLTLHLGMTGHFLVSQGRPDSEEYAFDSHTRFLFSLEPADRASENLGARSPSLTWLEFRDIRKFGRVQLTFGAPAERLSLLGPDAWKGEWGVDHLSRRLGGRRAPIKALLLDQAVLAGIGNIYADEILWEAEISPLRPAGALTPAELEVLAKEIPRRLQQGVDLLGCSISDFVDTEGQTGTFQQTLQAYGRQGQMCRRCGQTMRRVIVAGRGTAYCPGCQR